MIEAGIILLRRLHGLARSEMLRPWSIRESFIVAVAASALVGSLVGGAIMWSIERAGGTERPFVDCLFHVASAASSTGLITLDTSTLQQGSNVVILIAMLLYANTMLVTTMPVCIRLCRVRSARARWARAQAALLVHKQALATTRHCSVNEVVRAAESVKIDDDLLRLEQVLRQPSGKTNASTPSTTMGRRALAALGWKSARGATLTGAGAPGGEGGSSSDNNTASNSNNNTFEESNNTSGAAGSASMVRASGSTRSPGASVPLAEALGDALLSAELRSHEAHTRALHSFEAGPDMLGYVWVLACALGYYFLIVLAGFVCFVCWTTYNTDARAIMAANATPTGNTHPAWFSLYHSVSLFTNTGMFLFRDSMMQWSNDIFFVVTSGVIAALGFSFYPIGLRVFIVMVHAACPAGWAGGAHKAALADILARCAWVAAREHRHARRRMSCTFLDRLPCTHPHACAAPASTRRTCFPCEAPSPQPQPLWVHTWRFGSFSSSSVRVMGGKGGGREERPFPTPALGHERAIESTRAPPPATRHLTTTCQILTMPTSPPGRPPTASCWDGLVRQW